MIPPRINRNPKLTKHLRKLSCFKDDPFFLIDVGCSGGIPKDLIDIWGNDLRAIGFDPIVSEIERLKQNNTHPGIGYVDAFVGGSQEKLKLYDETDCPPKMDPDLNTEFMERTTSSLAVKIAEMSYTETYFNSGQKIVHSPRTVTLDEYLVLEDKKSVNFIKIDTDGFDHLVLIGAEETLRSPNLLGLLVEISFHRKIWETENSFSFVDRFLRKFGFSLYDIEAYRYSRGALPMPFCWDIPAQTMGGQINWGDVLYFRDYGRPDYESHWCVPSSTAAVLKLACLFEICELPDCAAELLIKYQNDVEKVTPLKSLLDLLTPNGRNYDEHIALFENHMKTKDWKGF